jgi:hypothetical protein
MDRVSTPLDQLLAAELDHARDLLVMMGDELAASPEIVAEYGMALQAVDIVGQMIGHIASVVRAADRDEAIEQIGMCDLKAKLSAA